MSQEHQYQLCINWEGETRNYNAYSRSHYISAEGKPNIYCSSDVSFRGDATMYNPEEMLVASIASCHMLWYLHLCAEAKIVVIKYTDNPVGIMLEAKDGSGAFKEVILHPNVIVTEASMIDLANELHEIANKKCFIANSVNFPILHRPMCILQ